MDDYDMLMEYVYNDLETIEVSMKVLLKRLNYRSRGSGVLEIRTPIYYRIQKAHHYTNGDTFILYVSWTIKMQLLNCHR